MGNVERRGMRGRRRRRKKKRRGTTHKQKDEQHLFISLLVYLHTPHSRAYPNHHLLLPLLLPSSSQQFFYPCLDRLTGFFGSFIVHAMASFYLNHLYVLPRLFEQRLLGWLSGWVVGSVGE